jgi:CubicO group peptidase (beta-lactamase class C family)
MIRSILQRAGRLALLLCVLIVTSFIPSPAVTQATALRRDPSIADTPPYLYKLPEVSNAVTSADAYLSSLTRSGKFSGTVLIARAGTVLLRKGYGWSGDRNGTPNAPETKFHLASISKQFTAMAILLLQADGKLKVQDRLCTYIPACPRAWRNITLHQLLTHTSGIPDYMSFANFDALQGYAVTPAQLITRFKYRRLNFTPGTRWRYSNSGYVLLGYIVERVSGMSYDAFLHQRIFDPLGMSNTDYDHGQAINKPLAYGFDDSGPADYMNMSVAYAAGGLYSTVDDLYQWDQALYTTTLASQDLLNLMFTPYVNVPGRNADYGYGWFLGKRQGVPTIEHPGSLDDFSTLIVRIPQDQTTLIILCNEPLNMNDISNAVISRIYSP